MDRGAVRRWIAGFEAVAAADREALRKRGADPAWAIAVAVSLFEAAAAGGSAQADPSREAADQAVRTTWARLRARLRR